MKYFTQLLTWFSFRPIYELKYEVGNRYAREHSNLQRHVDNIARETIDPRDGVYTDGMRIIKKKCKV